MSNRSTKLYLEDIINSITQIDIYVDGFSKDEFIKDQKTIDAVIRNLEIIGEAAKNLSDDYREVHSLIPWSEMISMRNKVVHEYFGVDEEILWQTIKVDLPKLKAQILELIEL